MDEDDPLVALRNARSRFIAGFHGQCDSLEALTVAGAPGGDAPERAAARQLVHRVVGLAGTIGFKSLSTRAAELESLLASRDGYGPERGRELTRWLREAFTNDLTVPPDWAVDPAAPSSALTILLVEDDRRARAHFRPAPRRSRSSGCRRGRCRRQRWRRSASRCAAGTLSAATTTPTWCSCSPA